jgi:hypothetical protein
MITQETMPFPPANAITTFPDRVRYTDDVRVDGKFACYSLVPLKHEATFLKAVNEDRYVYVDGGTTEYIAFAPKWNFTGNTLGDILDYHLELMKIQSDGPKKSYEECFDSSLFIVAIHEDCEKHGVLFVSLTYQFYDDFEHVPIAIRCGIDAMCKKHDEYLASAVCWCVNIEVGNMDIDETLEQYADFTWPAELPGYAELRASLDLARETQRTEVHERLAQLPVRPTRYVVHELSAQPQDLGQWRSQTGIEPDLHRKDLMEMHNRIATTHGLNSRSQQGSVQDWWQKARKEHPDRCAKRFPHSEPFWRVEKFWLLAYDVPATEKNGNAVALVNVIWDGVTEGKSKAELESLMPDMAVIERCEPAKALTRIDELRSQFPQKWHSSSD